jgi:hypothetical protein
MRLTWRLALALAAVALAAPVRARGQTCQSRGIPNSCSVNTTATMTAGRVLQLTVSPTSTAIPAPTDVDFTAGFKAGTGPTVTVRSNSTWTLKVGAQAATWTATNTTPGVPARANKPSTDLQWSTAVGGPFTPLTTGAPISLTGAATAGTVFTEFYRVLWSWTLDTPGNYSLTVTFTLSSP